MNTILRVFIVLSTLVGVWLGSCSSLPAQTQAARTAAAVESAENVLREYFDHLSEGSYEQAAPMYGGSLEVLQQDNPEVNQDDIAALFESACRLQLRCLPVKRVIGSEEISPGEFVFQVEFEGPDGEVFVLGPCCGASEEDMPPQSVFEVSVLRAESGTFRVMDLPVYVP